MSSVTPAADAQPLDEKELERKLKKDQKVFDQTLSS
jgi:hypothetical protein